MDRRVLPKSQQFQLMHLPTSHQSQRIRIYAKRDFCLFIESQCIKTNECGDLCKAKKIWQQRSCSHLWQQATCSEPACRPQHIGLLVHPAYTQESQKQANYKCSGFDNNFCSSQLSYGSVFLGVTRRDICRKLTCGSQRHSGARPNAVFRGSYRTSAGRRTFPNI